MYSAVLMTMLTVGGAESTGFGWRHGGHGCHGCHGCWSGCHGSGWGCYGCWGGHGCWGCYCGNCYGGYAGYCSGCWGCYGCYSPVIYGGAYHGCVGCHACTGCYGGVVIRTTVAAADTGDGPRTTEEADAVRRVLKELRERKSPPPGKEETAAAAAARLTVRVPADSKLWVDDSFCPLTDEVRTFSTPKLEAGRQYYYTLRMEVQRDGQTLTMSRRVYIGAGQTVNVDMNDLSTATVRR